MVQQQVFALWLCYMVALGGVVGTLPDAPTCEDDLSFLGSGGQLLALLQTKAAKLHTREGKSSDAPCDAETPESEPRDEQLLDEEEDEADLEDFDHDIMSQYYDDIDDDYEGEGADGRPDDLYDPDESEDAEDFNDDIDDDDLDEMDDHYDPDEIEDADENDEDFEDDPEFDEYDEEDDPDDEEEDEELGLQDLGEAESFKAEFEAEAWEDLSTALDDVSAALVATSEDREQQAQVVAKISQIVHKMKPSGHSESDTDVDEDVEEEYEDVDSESPEDEIGGNPSEEDTPRVAFDTATISLSTGASRAATPEGLPDLEAVGDVLTAGRSKSPVPPLRRLQDGVAGLGRERFTIGCALLLACSTLLFVCWASRRWRSSVLASSHQDGRFLLLAS